MSLRHPQGAELSALLNLGTGAQLEDLFRQTLSGPLTSLFDRPKKNLRGQIVELGFRIAGQENSRNLADSCEILEMLHAGSLVIDDIEDSSATRRGSPSLHHLFGIPLALNAGNWLYFLPFKYIDELAVSELAKIQLTRECFQTLLRAHYGQALDVGIRLHSLPQERVPEVTLSAIELKTGVLAGLAIKIGSLLSGRDDQDLERCGRQLGIALQMFDDIGNLTSEHNGKKRGEDLKNGRLNYLSSIAAQELRARDYAEYLDLCVRESHEPAKIQNWLETRGVISHARQRAKNHLGEVVTQLESRFSLGKPEISLLEELRQKLMVSYD